MAGEKVFNLLGMVVTVALVTTVVSRPQSAAVINALGSSFQGTIRAAMGR